jgi:hypothetical protein
VTRTALLGGTWAIKEQDTTPQSKAGRILAIIAGAGAGATAYALALTTFFAALRIRRGPRSSARGMRRGSCSCPAPAWSSSAERCGSAETARSGRKYRKDPGDGVFRF